MNDGRYPKAVQEGIAVEEMAEDLLIFDTRVQRAHSLNETASAVWAACDGEHSPEQLAERLGLDRDAVTLALQSLSDIASCSSIRSARRGSCRVARCSGAWPWRGLPPLRCR